MNELIQETPSSLPVVQRSPSGEHEAVSFGPAMQRLSAKRQRFALALVKEVKPGDGAEVAAAQIAGYAGSPAQIRATASRLVHDEAVIDAVIELARQEVLMDAPMALQTIREVAGNKFSKDRLKAAQLILDRFMPVVQQVSLNAEVVDHAADSVRYLAHLKAKGATDDFLLREFGELGLAHYSALLAAQEKAKPVDAEFVVLPTVVASRTPSPEVPESKDEPVDFEIEEF